MKVIPDAAIKRLTSYYRILHFFTTHNTPKIFSKDLASILSLNPAQVRKDLSYFGTFGKPRTGYNVAHLAGEISRILGISGERRVIIIGAGNLGTALASYQGFSVFGFRIIALFDIDIRKTGKNIKGIPCYHIKCFEKFVRKEKIEMAVISVPAESAQGIALLAVRSGIRAILNFAPVRLKVPESVKVNNLDLALELKSLSYYLK